MSYIRMFEAALYTQVDKSICNNYHVQFIVYGNIVFIKKRSRRQKWGDYDNLSPLRQNSFITSTV
jgi:hypothetical protein